MFQKRLIFNTRERAVSEDMNRAQYFASQAQGNQARALRGYFRANFYQANGYESSTTPPFVQASVLHGLLVTFVSSALHISGGAIEIYAAPSGDYSDDQSSVVFIEDQGTYTSGQGNFTLTSNATIYTRCDVIEVQPEDIVTEYDSRDTYEPATGLFSATTVHKVHTTRLKYRLRVGTPATQPSWDPDWIPVAIAIVQPSAASWAEVDFYDVRPLASELDASLGTPGFDTVTPWSPNQGTSDVVFDDMNIYTVTEEPDGVYRVAGHFKGRIRGMLVGGKIEKNTPSSIANFGGYTATPGGDIGYLDPRLYEEWVQGGYGGYGNALLCVWTPGLAYNGATLPFPRFVRYSQGTRRGSLPARIPQGPSGLLSFTHEYPTGPVTLNNAALMGCLGQAVGTPIAITTFSDGVFTPFNRTKHMCLFDPSYPYTLYGERFRTAVMPTAISLPAVVGSTHVLVLGPFPSWTSYAKKVRVIFQQGLVAPGSDGSACPYGCSFEYYVSTTSSISTSTQPSPGTTPQKYLVDIQSIVPLWNNTSVGYTYTKYQKFMVDVDMRARPIIASASQFYVHVLLTPQVPLGEMTGQVMFWSSYVGPNTYTAPWAQIVGVDW